jgi:hypothetical protein
MKKIVFLIVLVVATSLSAFAQSATVKDLISRRNAEIRKVEKENPGIANKQLRETLIDSLNLNYDSLIQNQLAFENENKTKKIGSTIEHDGPGGSIESGHISAVQGSKAYERIAFADAKYATANANAYFTMKVADAVVENNATFSARPINVGFEGTIANNNKYYSMEIVIYSTDSDYKKSMFIAPRTRETIYLMPGIYKAEIKVNGVKKETQTFSVRADRVHTYDSKPVYWYVYSGRNVRY